MFNRVQSNENTSLAANVHYVESDNEKQWNPVRSTRLMQNANLFLFRLLSEHVIDAVDLHTRCKARLQHRYTHQFSFDRADLQIHSTQLCVLFALLNATAVYL